MSNDEVLIYKINNCYYDKYRPPIESLHFIRTPLFKDLCKNVMCFYNNNIDTAKYLSCTRDLTNIGNKQKFDISIYNDFIGEYKNSGYNEFYSKNNRLHDNIALF